MQANLSSPSTASTSNQRARSAPNASTDTTSHTCDACGADLGPSRSRETVCPDCHVVQTTHATSPSRRPHYGNDDRKRTGSRSTNQWADRGLGTGITDADTDANGNALSRSQRRITRHSGWTSHRTADECRLDYALGEIRRMGAAFDLPEPELETAALLYRRARNAGSITGRSVEGFVTACLLAAIRQSPHHIPVSERELRAVTRADRDQIRVARSALTVELDVEIPAMDPVAFVPGAASTLGMPQDVERRARTLLDAYMQGDGAHRGVSPRTVAAASVHAAYEQTECAERPTLGALADVFDVAASTISTRKTELVDALEDR